jgi:putative ABC transport system substrate-binding protein
MDRRTFLGTLAGGLLATPLAVETQQARTSWRIGVLTPAPGPSHLFEAFQQGLRELGYVEGRNIVMEYRFAHGNIEALPELARDLVSLKVDVIVIDGTAAGHAAKQATTTIPIVMAAISDPVRSGIIGSLARPGGNITGLTLLAPELSVKRLELLKQALPRAIRLGVLWVAANPNGRFLFQDTEVAARSLRLEARPLEIEGIGGLRSALPAAAREKIQALIVLPDVVLFNNRAAIVKLAADHRLPAIYEERAFVKDGGLMSYGLSISESFYRAASYVDKILKGAKPADLPVEQPTKFELVINLKTAKALGLTIPQSLLQRADEVIQ